MKPVFIFSKETMSISVRFTRLRVWIFSISCFLVMSEELAHCMNPPNQEDQVIFGQGFLPLDLDKLISNCRAALLILVHPGYFISPVPTISGESSPIRHLGEVPSGRLATSHCINMDGKSTSSHDSKKFRTRSEEKQRRMAFGFREDGNSC